MSRKTETKITAPALFDLDELHTFQVKPTGDPWKITPDDPATVPVPLQTIIMKVDGPYTARDRKLWNFLLHAAFEELGEKSMHEISVREINSVFRQLGGDHNSDWIWESAKRLTRTVAEWEVTFGDDRILGVAAIFGANLTKSSRQSGMLHFYFPPNLIPIILEPHRFARLRVHFLLKLSGKYAVTLYEILEGFVNRRDNRLDVTIDDLRTWLKVKDGSYENWKDFRKWVLDPAVKQINADPMGAGFAVEYKPVREGRSYKRIVFTLTKTEARKRNESWALKKGDHRSRLQLARDENRPMLKPTDIEDAAQATQHYFDMEKMEAEFWAYWRSQGSQPLKSARAAFIGFCKKRYAKRH